MIYASHINQLFRDKYEKDKGVERRNITMGCHRPFFVFWHVEKSRQTVTDDQGVMGPWQWHDAGVGHVYGIPSLH